MAQIDRLVDNALGEARMLVLGLEVLLGFQYTAIFRSGFADLPEPARRAVPAAVALMLMALAALVSCVPMHRVAYAGEHGPDILRWAGRAMAAALLPFAAALGLALAIPLSGRIGATPAVACGAAATLFALFAWYGIELVFRTRRPPPMPEDRATPPLDKRISTVLTEARVALPGVQALLGFQLTALLSESFDRLETAAKLTHGAAMGAMVVAMVLLMAPPAWHRIVERGEDTPRMERITSALVLWALGFLAASLSADFFVLASKATGSPAVGLALAVSAAAMFATLWFAVPWLARRQT